LLVIEIKGRRKYPAKPLAKATEQAMYYAQKLQSFFFALYDGWNFLLFVQHDPYLIKLSNFLHIKDSLVRNLLLGLLEVYRHPFYSKTLESLPKIIDGWSFQQTILPSVAKSLASIITPKFEESWKILLAKWYPIIKEDREW
jgi:hypothetical protein